MYRRLKQSGIVEENQHPGVARCDKVVRTEPKMSKKERGNKNMISDCCTRNHVKGCH